MPDEQNTSHTSPFDAIRKVDEQGREYWSARDLVKLLGYKTNYRNFQTSINKAKIACETSGQAISDHFAQVRKQIKGGKGAARWTTSRGTANSREEYSAGSEGRREAHRTKATTFAL